MNGCGKAAFRTAEHRLRWHELAQRTSNLLAEGQGLESPKLHPHERAASAAFSEIISVAIMSGSSCTGCYGMVVAAGGSVTILAKLCRR